MSALQKALLLTAKQGAFAVSSIPIPVPGPGQLLLKVQATALNPVDWKIQAYGIIIEDYPFVLGSDIAGTVEAVGSGVQGFAKGDRVFTEGAFTSPHGGYQQYALANADVTAKIPSNLSFEQAATLPVGVATAALSLYTPDVPAGVDFGSARLPAPWEASGRDKYAGKPFVVIGGASSVGQYAIQFAKLSGFSPIIATASLHNASHLKSLGATHVLDRHLQLSALRSEIAGITSLPLDIIYDAISLPETQKAAYELLSANGLLVLVLNSTIQADSTDQKRIVKAFGQANFPEQNRATAKGLYKVLTPLLEQGVITPNRVEVLPGGLGGIVGGLEKLKKDAVSGVKLVALPQETE